MHLSKTASQCVCLSDFVCLWLWWCSLTYTPPSFAVSCLLTACQQPSRFLSLRYWWDHSEWLSRSRDSLHCLVVTSLFKLHYHLSLKKALMHLCCVLFLQPWSYFSYVAFGFIGYDRSKNYLLKCSKQTGIDSWPHTQFPLFFSHYWTWKQQITNRVK